MFLKEKTEAIILAGQPSGEADRQIVIFTDRFGKLRASARGEKKILSKLRSGLGLFSWSEVELIFGYRQPIITDARPKNAFINLGREWPKFLVARQMTRDIEMLTPWELPDHQAWFLYLGAMHALNNINRHYQRLYYYFLWTLMSSWGYQIDLERCARCSRHLLPEICYLVAQEGIICSECCQKDDCLEAVSPNTIKILRLIANKDKNRLARIRTGLADRENLEKVSRFFLEAVCHHQPFRSSVETEKI